MARSRLKSPEDGGQASSTPDPEDHLTTLQDLPEAERRAALDLLPGMARGPGKPLVAELATAYQNQAA